MVVLGCLVAQFARESVKITTENKFWRILHKLRLGTGTLIIAGTLFIFIWSLS